MIQILRAADRTPIPWKNGGGRAEDIASGPADATWDAMDWRVSRAWIEASGPFSVFGPIDRTFMVADGDGVELSPAGMPAARLDMTSAPFSFPGDVATGCRLLGGPVIAFNLMTARGRWRHRLARRACSGPTELAGAATLSFAVLLQGAARMGAEALALQDAVRLPRGEHVTLDASGATIAWVELWDAPVL
ncbi:hypothetical protein EDC65_2763 [Stella humosa]|uniref:HutD protein n=1 Tax=Stella humosa TaxID=94 RepID=A0A3N1L8A0_9PROT|nr:HutD family protein [Stella humosa]ROP90903.1 hypothetical protein EDC65_2763 [Stella humosa]BBK34747.1 hypothetical protein STHU_53810 [Stella humosa]